MLLISDKIRALATLLCPLAFCGSRGRVLSWTLALPRTEAFFLVKPLQLAGMSVASGTATLILDSLTVFKKVNVISLVISSSPEGFR